MSVVVYTSSVAGNLTTKKHTSALENLFAAKKIPFTLVDISLAENESAKVDMASKSGKNTLPQVFVDGEFKGVSIEEFAELEDANEMGELKTFLGL